jgi:hypothetical protein
LRIARSMLGVLALLALLYPEFPRYAAERRIYRVTGLFQALLADPGAVPDLRTTLDWTAETALSASEEIPGDSRPLMLAGSAHLVSGHWLAAIEVYRRALSAGERAEIDLNLGRAYGSLGRSEEARLAFLRAGWVNPIVLESLPRDVRGPIVAEIAGLEKDLVEGRLTSPPVPAPRG